MTTRPPAEIGMPLDEVDTPALIIDLDAFERNLDRLPQRDIGQRCARCARTPRPTNAPSSPCSRWRRVPSASACKRSARPRRWSTAAVADVLVTNEIVGRQNCGG